MDILPTGVTRMQRRMVHVMDIVEALLAVESLVRVADQAVVLVQSRTSLAHGEVGQVGHRPMTTNMILHLANRAKVDMAHRRLVNLAKVALVI